MKGVMKKESRKKIAESEYLNEVTLIGRLSGSPTEKNLPSGDKVVEFRVVIPRKDKLSKSKKGMVDTIDIAAWSAINRKIAMKLNEHSWIAITGSIRRRFWQSPTGLASRWQVEASEISTL
jgi:single-strand DNA-binding protein